MPKYKSECTGDQILNFQNTFDRACDEIRMEIQTEHFFWGVGDGAGGVINLVEIRLPKYFCKVSPACRYRAENIFGGLISTRLQCRFFFSYTEIVLCKLVTRGMTIRLKHV